MASTRTTPPVGYQAIERALRLLDLGEGSRWVAAKLKGVPHPAALRATRLLRQGEREEARRVLGAALLALAGPSDGSGLAWFQSEHPADASGVKEPRRA